MDIPVVRRSNDLVMSVTIKDQEGNFVDWFALSNISAHIYSRQQHAVVGDCDLGEIEGDVLTVVYSSKRNSQCLGVNDLVLIFDVNGRTYTLKKSVVEFVPYSHLAYSRIPDTIKVGFKI